MKVERPCVFCGGSDVTVEEDEGHRFRARCSNCEATGPLGRSSEEALERWNAQLWKEWHLEDVETGETVTLEEVREWVSTHYRDIDLDEDRRAIYMLDPDAFVAYYVNGGESLNPKWRVVLDE